MINYKILADAIEFYRGLGYEYVEVPWAVDWKAMEITTPVGAQSFAHRNGFLVASGEQSFLEMLQKGTLKPGRYVCLTPCFRGEKEYNEYTKPYFMKVELIVAGSDRTTDVKSVLHDAQRFFNRYFRKPVQLVKTDIGTDIFYEGVELGSYGARNDGSTGPWVYGTGVAEPRFSTVLSKVPKSYTWNPVPKGEFGTLAKIEEELEELKDAIAQGVRIMSEVELADMYGAMEGFLARHFAHLTMDDLRRMNECTKRSFQNGYRK